MLAVHHLDTSRSERIVRPMEGLDLPCRIERFGPARWGVVLAESGAIASHALARHGGGRLRPKPEDADFPAYLFWLHASEGTLGAQLLRPMTLRRALPDAGDHPGVARTRRDVEDALGLVEATVAAAPSIAGERSTGADITRADRDQVGSPDRVKMLVKTRS